MRKLSKNLLPLTVGLLLAFGMAEASLMLLKYPGTMYRFDSGTNLYTLYPTRNFNYSQNCFRNQVETNSEGFHDQEFSQNKSKEIFRIIILGDSFVEALQVPSSEAFYHVLQDRLNREYSDRKFEVYGLGKSGNGTFANYQYLNGYGLKYKPDLVINAFLVGNDFRDDSLELSKLFTKEAGYDVMNLHTYPVFDSSGRLLNPDEKFIPKKKILNTVVTKSLFLTWTYRSYREYKNKKYFTNVDQSANQITLDQQVYLKNYPPIWEQVWQNEKNLLAAMNKKVMENQAKFLLLSLSENYRIAPPLNEDLDYEKPERLLTEISKEEQVSYLALRPIFKQLYEETGINPHFECDGHWNETGHKWAADALFTYLAERKELLLAK